MTHPKSIASDHRLHQTMSSDGIKPSPPSPRSMASDQPFPPTGDRPLPPEEQRIVDEFQNLIGEDTCSPLPYLPRNLFSYFRYVHHALYMSLSTLDQICHDILAKQRCLHVLVPHDVEILCYLRKLTGWNEYVIVIPKLPDGSINPEYESTSNTVSLNGFRIMLPALSNMVLQHEPPHGLNNEGILPDPLGFAASVGTLANFGRLSLSDCPTPESSDVLDVSQDPGLAGPSVTNG